MPAKSLFLVAVCTLGVLIAPSLRALPPTQPSEAEFRSTLALQIALEGHGYSPGLLDGRDGPKTRTAVASVQAGLGFRPTGATDSKLLELLGVDEATALTSYRVKEEDVKQVGEVPTGWIARSEKDWLPYPSVGDLVAEKFHTSRRCLERLNTVVALETLTAGDTLHVPARRSVESRYSPPVSFLEIDVARKVVLLLYENGKKERFLHGILHCSTPANSARVSFGEHRVSVVANFPEYTFNPSDWPEVADVDRKLRIPPGPRNPVGACWIGLDRRGVGIHGTPQPENIGKTGSHGCFRLTNWDATWLARLVEPGTPVRIYARSQETSWHWRKE